MQVRVIGAKALLRTLKKASKNVNRVTWAKVREASFALLGKIKVDMPKDTSRATASWGKWTPGDLKPGAFARRSDAVWQENQRKLEVTQGTNVPYVPKLEEGHSKQAPAGFIERNWRITAEALPNEISRAILGELFK